MKADNSPCGYIYFLLHTQKKVTKKTAPRGSAGFAGSLAPCPGRASRETRASRSNSAACFFRPLPWACGRFRKGDALDVQWIRI
jgi:hypothetical protein